MARNL